MSYDLFLSHSHVDKAWTRTLHDRVANTDYHGRSLRAWLDQEILDPGDLSSSRELESALDRSRVLVVVLTPESLASPWVRHEIDYFIDTRRLQDVVVIRRRPCAVPDRLETAVLIEWPEGEDEDEQPCTQLLDVLRPAAGGDYTEYEHRKRIRKAWASARFDQPPGFDPTPTEANGRLLELLLSYDIGDLVSEGPALVGFDRVGQLVGEVDAAAAYGTKMVLGEFLAIAIARDPAYAGVASRYVRQDISAQSRPSFLTVRNRLLRRASGPASSTNLLLAVARATSKLAELDPTRIDLSTMSAVLYNLDQRPGGAGDERSVAMMIGRTLAKLRNAPLIDVLIHTLVRWGGDASMIAAATAISTSLANEDDLVYFTSELADLAPDPEARPVLAPPSETTARLLLDSMSRLRTARAVHDEVLRCRDAFVSSFGSDWPLGTGLWPALRYAPVPTGVENGPLVGTIRRVTLANMETLADTLGATDIACLTEPRIVDALLPGASGYVIDAEQAGAPLGQRLRNRGARYATYDRARLDSLKDGAVIALWPGDGDTRGWGFIASPG